MEQISMAMETHPLSFVLQFYACRALCTLAKDHARDIVARGGMTRVLAAMECFPAELRIRKSASEALASLVEHCDRTNQHLDTPTVESILSVLQSRFGVQECKNLPSFRHI
jgi:hypothetical protein